MRNAEVEFTIPHFYKEWANGSKERYLKYIQGYVNKSFPEYRAVKVVKDKVVCVKR